MTILIADDNADFRAFVSSVFERVGSGGLSSKVPARLLIGRGFIWWELAFAYARHLALVEHGRHPGFIVAGVTQTESPPAPTSTPHARSGLVARLRRRLPWPPNGASAA